MDRFSNLDIWEGQQAADLLDNELFQKAVKNILNDYAAVEEDLLVDNNVDVRDITARIRANAQMRRAVLDVVGELNRFIVRAQNSSYEQEFGD